jgi:hypothetical protein
MQKRIPAGLLTYLQWQRCTNAVIMRQSMRPMKISRQDWERVIEKACDIANATENEGDPMYGVHVESVMTLLDELQATYGPQPQLLATRADYLDCAAERRQLYEQALDLARKAHDLNEIEEIMDSINQLNLEERVEPRAAPNDPGGLPSVS